MLAISVHDGKVALEEDRPEPRPGEGEVLLAPRLAGICATDLEIVKGYMGFTGVLGHEFVATVVDGPPRLQGRRVVCDINCVCGNCSLCQSGLANHCRHRTVIGISGRDGCFAERIAVPEMNLYEVPDTLSDEEAVFAEPVAAAIQITRQFPVEPRMKVVVLGSGRLGSLVAQVLRTTGCRLELVGRNPDLLLFSEKKGIQTRLVGELVPRPEHDLVVDCTGDPQGIELAMQLVRPRGTIVLKSTFAEAVPINPAPLVINEVSVIGSRCGPLADAINLLARKQLDVRSLITRQLPLQRALEALAAAAEPRHMKVLIKIGQ
jgi:threonine dehydrogenase-like Zn-dependent dehydrogenase